MDLRRRDGRPPHRCPVPGIRDLAHQPGPHLPGRDEPGGQRLLRGLQPRPAPGRHRLRLEPPAVALDDSAAAALAAGAGAGIQGICGNHCLCVLRGSRDGALPQVPGAVRDEPCGSADPHRDPRHPAAGADIRGMRGQRVHAPGHRPVCGVEPGPLAQGG